MIDFKYFAAGVLILWAALILILLIVHRRRMLANFSVTLYDIKKRPEKILDTFTFSISSSSSGEGINAIAFKMLKERDIYESDDDVKEFTRFYELGGDTAGYEFDVLPEALRRLRLEIRSLSAHNCNCSGH